MRWHELRGSVDVARGLKLAKYSQYIITLPVCVRPFIDGLEPFANRMIY